MKSLFLSLVMMFSVACGGLAATRSVQQEADLKQYIQGIQSIAQGAVKKAELAEKEAAEARAQLDNAGTALTEANSNADMLQKAIDEQTNALNNAIVERDRAKAHDEKTTKRNNVLKNILALEAAVMAVLACLWLRVPSLSPPWGLVATVASPVLVFGLVKLIL